MTVYIPSFFNEYPERIELFNNCVKSYLKLGFNLVIFWMNDEKYLILDDKIEYIISKEILNASMARNKLLDIFYESDEPKAIFSDDDVIFEGITEYDFEYDVLSLTNDFSDELNKTHMLSSSVFYLKKLSKKLYFDETLNANQDMDFGLNLVKNGFLVFRIKDNKIKLNRGKSVMFENQMNRLYLKDEALKKIKLKWQ